MDTSSQVVAVKASTGKRQRRSIAEKRRIVEETLADGASVARVARAHGVNANQVFYWRRLHQTGKLGASDGAQLLPVRVKRESKPRTVAHEGLESSLASSSATLSAGMIHIEFREALVRIEGNADPALLRVLLECLGR